MSKIVIGVIGDSITNGYNDEEGLGWFGRMSQKIASNFTGQFAFCNMAKSGDMVPDAYHRMAAETMTKSIDILLVMVGVNDIIRSPNKEAGTSLSDYGRDRYWVKMLDVANASGAEVVVFDILPSYEKALPFVCDRGELYFLNSDIEKHNQLIENLCKERGMKFVKRYDDWLKKNLKNLYSDAVHPNAKGHQVIAEEVYEELWRQGILK
ncbi:MAG: SGNH/GDSL hydrolase family protein [Lactobacillus sp.]|jgi:lysophospholipase L1-like esterase|nr:SGNH/GDSL hydrolase family protein [Lactobacillus sp.]